MEEHAMKRIHAAAVMFVVLLPALLSGGEGYTVTSVVGDVSVIRGTGQSAVKIGNALGQGDLLRLEEHALAVLVTGKGMTLNVKGPSIFRIEKKHLETSIKRGGILYNMYRYYTGQIQYKAPHNIVAAVRGMGRKGAGKDADEAMKRALEKFQEGKYREAWGLFGELETRTDLRNSARKYILFYKGEILFGERKYDDALRLYSALYRINPVRFSYAEDSHIRAIICAEHTGNSALMDSLAAEYREKYGTGGKYSEMIMKLR